MLGCNHLKLLHGLYIEINQPGTVYIYK